MSKKRQTVRALAVKYAAGHVLDAHTHAWHQLLHASEGVMLVEAAHGAWVVPPLRAVWLPAHEAHRIAMRGAVAMRTLYFDTSWKPPFEGTRVLDVPPLLRELLAYGSTRGALDMNDAHEARVAGLVMDLLSDASPPPLDLPMPRDARARRVAQAIRARPGSDATPSVLAARAGASVRTVERFFLAETGMTLGRWRQQARILEALTLLAEGMPVASVAAAVGYASPSAFITMFRGALGTTPSKLFGYDGVRDR